MKPRIKINIDDSVLALVREIAVYFEFLDQSVQSLIWHLLGADQRTGQIVTSEMSFRRVLNLFACLVRHRAPHVSQQRLDDFVARLNRANENRNRIIHSRLIGGFPSGGGEILRMKITAKQKGVQFQFQQLTHAELKAIADELAEAELYDPATGAFTATSAMHSPRDAHAAVLLADVKVLIVGGDTVTVIGDFGYYAGSLASAELYDPLSGTFWPAGSMNAARTAPQATLLKNGDVLITGGFSYCGIGCFHGSLASAELYHPPLSRRRAVHPR